MLEYRNEYKFLCSQGELMVVQARLAGLMRFDSHQKGESYRIRSLYLDDWEESAFHENAAGVDKRKKFRIRVYDEPLSRIRLEIKHKVHGKTRKESCDLPEELCREIMAGRTIPPDPDYPYPLALLYAEMQLRRLLPRIIVEYERTVLVCPVGNVRITLDRNISWSSDFPAFLDDRIALRPVLPPGMHVLEIKYDELLPDYIMSQLCLGELRWSTFSKFYLSCLAQKGEHIC